MASIAIFKTAPVHMAGTVGAIFNGALQLGSAVGIAAVTSIETSVERKHGGFTGYSGRAAAWWFLVGIVSIEALAVVIFYRTGTLEDKTPQVEGACAGEKHIPAQCTGIVVELPVLESGDWQPPVDEKRA
ncbi:hypothetical protein PHLCEN_2v9070 [Hermanssonia centrifuga]|uniref:Uncharacterized protein n=1 Tax=Hermanssonia centrifuga TaxID=98765 RepID=A0A2R6NRX4_9APHY|nr:hypothetical protein PHLCEN_2v9070 [Hermanssonia centrifuga]